MKIHKRSTFYIESGGLFSCHIPTPVCEGAKGVWNGRKFIVTHFWKNVTCKKCLKKKDRGDS